MQYLSGVDLRQSTAASPLGVVEVVVDGRSYFFSLLCSKLSRTIKSKKLFKGKRRTIQKNGAGWWYGIWE